MKVHSTRATDKAVSAQILRYTSCWLGWPRVDKRHGIDPSNNGQKNTLASQQPIDEVFILIEAGA